MRCKYVSCAQTCQPFLEFEPYDAGTSPNEFESGDWLDLVWVSHLPTLRNVKRTVSPQFYPYRWKRLISKPKPQTSLYLFSRNGRNLCTLETCNARLELSLVGSPLQTTKLLSTCNRRLSRSIGCHTERLIHQALGIGTSNKANTRRNSQRPALAKIRQHTSHIGLWTRCQVLRVS